MISLTMTAKTSRVFPFIEAFGFVAFVAWFIWQLQDASRYSWIVFPVWLITSFALNKDTTLSLGWRVDNLWSATKRASAVFLPCAFVILVTGFFLDGVRQALHHFLLPHRFFGYLSFCLLQQIGLNSLVTNRLLTAMDSPLRVPLISGLFFALLHWPNPVLVPLTFVGGAMMAWLFWKERNILPLVLWQTILGTLVWKAFPIAWHHAMRVGPGFYRFHGH
ncbi:MAG TPA: CPBP family intramembrane glutamic endopeptidase [Candidatus Dormibacteraeota bacterium]|nr:CPBP family intramembrane glutamic endopeptidase [Candidatus Dormibacteraeota bacterium]